MASSTKELEIEHQVLLASSHLHATHHHDRADYPYLPHNHLSVQQAILDNTPSLRPPTRKARCTLQKHAAAPRTWSRASSNIKLKRQSTHAHAHTHEKSQAKPSQASKSSPSSPANAQSATAMSTFNPNNPIIFSYSSVLTDVAVYDIDEPATPISGPSHNASWRVIVGDSSLRIEITATNNANGFAERDLLRLSTGPESPAAGLAAWHLYERPLPSTPGNADWHLRFTGEIERPVVGLKMPVNTSMEAGNGGAGPSGAVNVTIRSADGLKIEVVVRLGGM